MQMMSAEKFVAGLMGGRKSTKYVLKIHTSRPGTHCNDAANCSHENMRNGNE